VTTPFIVSGVFKGVLAPAVASLAGPTRAEIAAGTIFASAGNTMGTGLVSIAGLETQPQDIAGPDVNSRVDKMYKGRKTLPTATIQFKDTADGSGALKAAFAEDVAGFVILMHYGDVAARNCEVWPGRVTDVNRSQVTSANELAMWTVSWVCTEEPEKDAVIPALS